MKTIKVSSFKIDRSLGYLIQNSTKDTTQQILSYFYSVALFTSESLAKKSKAFFTERDIVLFYKETPISYRLRIRGRLRSRRDENFEPSVSVSVGYPNESDLFDVKDIINSIVETGLDLVDENKAMPQFEVPNLKTPLCLRKVRIAQSEERRKSST